MIVKTFRKVVHISNNSGVRTVVLRLAAMGIGGYGIYAFMYRRLGDYMLQSWYFSWLTLSAAQKMTWLWTCPLSIWVLTREVKHEYN